MADYKDTAGWRLMEHDERMKELMNRKRQKQKQEADDFGRAVDAIPSDGDGLQQ